MKADKIIRLMFILYFVSVLLYSIYFINPMVMGDGPEYLGMTISFHNHFTPDLRNEDIALREQILAKNAIHFDAKYDYSGYFESLNGAYYSYHFWIYPLFNLPVFALLHYFNFNELRSFQITNSFLLLFSLFMVLNIRNRNLKLTQRSWLFLLLAFSPILLYLRWPHPEVFIYSFVVVSITLFLNNSYRLAVFASSIASLQNPAILILTFYFIICGWNASGLRLRELSILSIFGSISAIPYIFYYLNYHSTSLIVFSGASSIRNISINKILSLFFDFNFGLVVYIPLLLFMSLFLLVTSIKRKSPMVPFLWLVLIGMAVIYSTQLNWNCGMMYIHRYSVCMLPLIILIIAYSLPEESAKKIYRYLFISLLITSAITGVSLYNYDTSNHVRFNTLSTMFLINAPGLYNPPYEVFAERSLNEELYTSTYPILLTYKGIPRKALTDYDNISVIEQLTYCSIRKTGYDNIKNEIISYINFGAKIFKFPYDKTEFVGFKVGLQKNGNVSYGLNWYNWEDWSGTPTRWMENDATLIITSLENRTAALNFNALSFYRPRTLNLYVNNQPHAWAEVPTEGFVMVKVPVDLNRGVNIVKLKVPEGCDRPCDITGCEDKRCLSLAIQDIKITEIL